MKDDKSAALIHDFARAIAPMTPEVFFDEYFEKKHLVIKREDPGYYKDLLSLEDIDHVLTQGMFPGENMQMVNNGNGIDVGEYTTNSGFVDPVRMAQQFSQGGTVILPQLNRSLPKLTEYCRALETVFSCDLQTNIYMTPDNAQGFKTHFDSHDVIVLQTHGSKTWNIYESPLELPLRSQAFDPKSFQAGEIVDTFVLNAGDMAYVPRGVVHDAIATNEVSLHITTGLLAWRWIDIIVDAFDNLAKTDLAFRASVPPGFSNDGYDFGPAVEQFQGLIERAVASLDPMNALDAAAYEFRRRRVPLVPGQLLQNLGVDAIGAGCVVSKRTDMIYNITKQPGENGESVVLEVYGTEIAFPDHVEESLREALSADQFVVGQLGGDLDEAGQAVMARRLVREGVLFRV